MASPQRYGRSLRHSRIVRKNAINKDSNLSDNLKDLDGRMEIGAKALIIHGPPPR